MPPCPSLRRRFPIGRSRRCLPVAYPCRTRSERTVGSRHRGRKPTNPTNPNPDRCGPARFAHRPRRGMPSESRSQPPPSHRHRRSTASSLRAPGPVRVLAAVRRVHRSLTPAPTWRLHIDPFRRRPCRYGAGPGSRTQPSKARRLPARPPSRSLRSSLLRAPCLRPWWRRPAHRTVPRTGRGARSRGPRRRPPIAPFDPGSHRRARPPIARCMSISAGSK